MYKNTPYMEPMGIVHHVIIIMFLHGFSTQKSFLARNLQIGSSWIIFLFSSRSVRNRFSKHNHFNSDLNERSREGSATAQFSYEKKKRGPLLSMKSWLLNRDPYNGLLKSLNNWIV